MDGFWADHISFSSLSCIEQCPYQYYLLKIAGIEPVENAFSQAGTVAHDLLAGWAKGEIPINELPIHWIDQFGKKVTAEFPHYLKSKGYADKLFESILHYFETFDGFPGYDILGVEKAFSSSIAGEKFVGVIDLVLQSQETGELVLVDHKSCSLSSFRKSREQMYRQLLLYAKYCADEYGAFPAKLCFNLFRENTIDERPFSREDYIAARIWAESVIASMKAKDITDWFITQPEYFRCTNLCGCRHECAFGRPENHKKKENNNGSQRIPATV